VNTQDFQCFCQIQHLCDRGRLLERVAPKRVSEPGELSMQIHVGSGRPFFQDSGLPLDRGMLEPKVQAAAPQWIANPANLVRGQHNKRSAPRFDRADLGDGDLSVTQDFKELRLEFLAHFVDLVDQQDTRFLAQKRPQQWSFLEELKRMEVAAQGRPFRT